MSGRLSPRDKNQPVLQSLFTGQLAKEEVGYDTVFLQLMSHDKKEYLAQGLLACLSTGKNSIHSPVNPFTSIRCHWRPPLSLPDGAIRRQWRPNKKV